MIEVTSPSGLAPRALCAMAVTDARAPVWGGSSAPKPEAHALDEGAVLDLRTLRWRAMSRAHAPSPRWMPTAVAWTGSRLLVWGGAVPDATLPARNRLLGDGGSYDPATDRWAKVGAPPEGIVLPRANIGPLTRILVAPDGRVLFLPERLTTTAVLDPESARWSTIAVGRWPAAAPVAPSSSATGSSSGAAWR